MGEVAKRCKHQLALWSREGLKKALPFPPLIHYTNTTLHKEYWKNIIFINAQ
jgi:hypothetical protein